MIVSIVFLTEGSLLSTLAKRRLFELVQKGEVIVLVNLTAARLSTTMRRLVTELSTIWGALMKAAMIATISAPVMLLTESGMTILVL